MPTTATTAYLSTTKLPCHTNSLEEPLPTRLLRHTRTTAPRMVRLFSTLLDIVDADRDPHVAGEPDSHAKAKEIFAGLAGAIIDREVETKGLDFIDKERAKRHAEEQFSNEYQNRN